MSSPGCEKQSQIEARGVSKSLQAKLQRKREESYPVRFNDEEVQILEKQKHIKVKKSKHANKQAN